MPDNPYRWPGRHTELVGPDVQSVYSKVAGVPISGSIAAFLKRDPSQSQSLKLWEYWLKALTDPSGTEASKAPVHKEIANRLLMEW
jgi:hypothetical protein